MIDDSKALPVDDVYAHIETGDTVDWLAQIGGEWEAERQMQGPISGEPLSTLAIGDFLHGYTSAEWWRSVEEQRLPSAARLLSFGDGRLLETVRRRLNRPAGGPQPGFLV